MAGLEIRVLPVLSDNYVYLLRDPDGNSCAVVDPAVADPVLAAVDELGWKLTHILCTHHHMDHVGGNLDIKKKTGCAIIGAAADRARIPGIDTGVAEGDMVSVGEQVAKVFEVPGHTSGHIAYWFEGSNALFCGDTLFSLGCGRLFEGTPAQMWSSLCKLRDLPGDTEIYCGHEYTNSNADFALSVDPDNGALKARADEILTQRQAGQPTIPAKLADEIAANPFLRADNADLLAAAGLQGSDPVSAFAEIRRRKDSF
jgi:hydroxyacylglutathione hydrolase